MEASDAAEHIVEASEGEGRTEDEKFRSRTALTIAFTATSYFSNYRFRDH